MPEIAKLLRIMARLRDPHDGCPWDLEQDFASISPHTIEEAYEVDEAIATGDLDALRDELGDLLFQVVFQARLAEEQGAFDFASVVEAIADKLVRRHPHVFADAPTPRTPEERREQWESIKALERERSPRCSESGAPDPFAGIPRGLPALSRAAKILSRLERFSESERHLAQPMPHPLDPPAPPEPPGGSSATEIEEWVGRGLRSWVRRARGLGVDPEAALRRLDDRTIDALRRRAHQGSDDPVR